MLQIAATILIFPSFYKLAILGDLTLISSTVFKALLCIRAFVKASFLEKTSLSGIISLC